ncbi:hypothetical protein SUGI_0945720 [Cryptomeria japonica]|nr:hypothetical protein SUGI_0945720 [Cryptomeria japonica]
MGFDRDLYGTGATYKHGENGIETEFPGADRVAFSGPLSGLLSGQLNKRGSRRSAKFNVPETSTSSGGAEDGYVEITLDVRDDSVAIQLDVLRNVCVIVYEQMFL